MIKKVAMAQNTISFLSKPEEEAHKETHILPNNLQTKTRQGVQRVSSAFIDYPVKGLQGDINSNFYEFLTMGIVPYLTGSAMFMLVFNCVNKFLSAKGRQISTIKGQKMALGVVLYGLFKTLSKNLVTKPIKAFTGVDTEMPYENKVYNLPKGAEDNAEVNIVWQQRKVFDSKEFFRKDLLATGDYEGKGINLKEDSLTRSKKYYDMVAKKLGLGENLNDSATEVTPIIQNIVATSGTAKSLASYCWAALGVCLAVQDNWSGFFESFSNKINFKQNKDATIIQNILNRFKVFGENTLNITKEFFKSFGKSCKSLWQGKGNFKNAGKVFTLATAALTAFLTANTIVRAKKLAKNNNKNTIDKNKGFTEI